MKMNVSKITRQSLPAILEHKFPDPWSPRVTRYVFKDGDLKKVRLDPAFVTENGAQFQVGTFRLQHIGSLGSIESGSLIRIVQVTTPPEGETWTDYLGDLCEDPSGPLGDKASQELRERFDILRCEFDEFGLFGEQPTLSGVKKRREQRKTVNDFARRLFPKDREGARLFAEMLVEHIVNMEPAVELE